jgi:4'-phosphopantetheinyl transferase
MLEHNFFGQGPTRKAVMLKHNRQYETVSAVSLPTAWVDVWSVPLVAASDQTDALWESLSSDERERASRFVFEKDRRRFVVGRGALRSILASYLGSHAGSIRFAYGEHGKPMLAESTGGGSLEFNASGSGELAVCAVTVGRKVGVDIELRRLPQDDAVVEQSCSPAERHAYGTLSSKEKPEAFYRLWTLKEAYLKATGAGLSRPLSSFDVTVLPGQRARLAADDLVPEGGENWTFVEFQPGPAHVGALVISGDERPLKSRSWSL